MCRCLKQRTYQCDCTCCRHTAVRASSLALSTFYIDVVARYADPNCIQTHDINTPSASVISSSLVDAIHPYHP